GVPVPHRPPSKVPFFCVTRCSTMPGRARLRCRRACRSPRPGEDMMRPSPDDAALLNHFTLAIYPFLHTVSPTDREARVHALSSRGNPWWSRLNAAGLAEPLDATGFFLPYARGLL